MNLIFEPKFTDQIMGYPGLSGVVEAVGTVDDWIYYMGQAMKQSAAWAVTPYIGSTISGADFGGGQLPSGIVTFAPGVTHDIKISPVCLSGE